MRSEVQGFRSSEVLGSEVQRFRSFVVSLERLTVLMVESDGSLLLRFITGEICELVEEINCAHCETSVSPCLKMHSF